MNPCMAALLLLAMVAGGHVAQAAATPRKLLDAAADEVVQAASAFPPLPDLSNLSPAAAKLLECLQQPVIKAGVAKRATRAQRQAAGAAIAQCYKDNEELLRPPTGASGEVAAAAAAAKIDLSAAINALLPARLLVSAVDALTRSKDYEVAKQVLALFVANTGCGKPLVDALAPFNTAALKLLLAAAMADQTVLGSCKAEDVPPLLLALAASYCPDNQYVTCKSANNNFQMFEKRQGALLAAATSTALLRLNRTQGVTLGRSVFRAALAMSQTSSAAACKAELPALVAAIPSEGTLPLSAAGVGLLCDSVNLTSPAGAWQPSVLLQAGCIDPINAAALQLRATYKSAPKQLQAQTAFYCEAWKDTLTFGSVSLFSSAPTGFRCMLQSGAGCAAPLPFGFAIEPEVAAQHDLTYTVDAAGAVTLAFICP